MSYKEETDKESQFQSIFRCKANPDIEGLHFFNQTFLYYGYPDDTTFFLRNEKSVTEVIKTLDNFSLISGLKINNVKGEITGIGVKKGVSTPWNEIISRTGI